MIGIFEEFFIQFCDSLINSFIRIIDFIILFLNKFNSDDNLDTDEDFVREDNFGGGENLDSESNSNNETNLTNKEIFKINNFLKNDSIFEGLENRYSKNSSSLSKSHNMPQNIFSHNESQNIFTSLNAVKNKNDEGNDGDLNQNKDNFQNGLFESIKEKAIYFLINNKYLRINESNVYNLVLRIIIIVFSILTIIVVFVSYFMSLELGLAILISFILIAFAIFYYPKIRRQNDYASFSREMPYALRQLATELRSGKSLFDSMASIVESDYGIVSLEFARVLEEIKYGESTETAFLNLEKRVDCEALSRVIYEILTSMRVGANLSTSLTIIADDVNFDIRMKLKEYSEKLNAFIMIYTFLAILAPVILLTMLLASSVIIGDLVPGDLILVLYSVFFPMIIVFLGFAIKRLEPKL